MDSRRLGRVHIIDTNRQPEKCIFGSGCTIAGERCWGILELQWNGAKLIDVETMLGWAKKMTWKGMHPVVELSRKVYAKGIALSKAAMQAVEARLKRDPQLPKYDILVNPASPS